jgi:hypothetical protein
MEGNLKSPSTSIAEKSPYDLYYFWYDVKPNQKKKKFQIKKYVGDMKKYSDNGQNIYFI